MVQCTSVVDWEIAWHSPDRYHTGATLYAELIVYLRIPMLLQANKRCYCGIKQGRIKTFLNSQRNYISCSRPNLVSDSKKVVYRNLHFVRSRIKQREMPPQLVTGAPHQYFWKQVHKIPCCLRIGCHTPASIRYADTIPTSKIFIVLHNKTLFMNNAATAPMSQASGCICKWKITK